MYSKCSDFAWRFWTLNIGQMSSKFTLLSKDFKRFAKKLVWYLFETLPFATRFNLEPMVFLIEIIFRQVSKIGIKLSKIKKVRKFWHLCCNLDELHPSFSPLAFWIILKILLFYSSNTFVIWTNIGNLLSNNVLFVCFMDFWVFLRTILTKMQLSLQNCLLKIPGVVNIEFFKPFNAKKVLKKWSKNGLKMLKKTWNFSVFRIFGNCWGNVPL